MTKGLLLVLSAPSGCGKTTILNRVLSTLPGLVFSVSHTTRAPRPGEVDHRQRRRRHHVAAGASCRQYEMSAHEPLQRTT